MSSERSQGEKNYSSFPRRVKDNSSKDRTRARRINGLIQPAAFKSARIGDQRCEVSEHYSGFGKVRNVTDILRQVHQSPSINDENILIP